MKKIFLVCSVFISSLLIGMPVPVFAQSTNRALESCFDYYNYAKVHVNLTPERESYSPGETIKLKGTIVNNNTFPIIDTVLYAQLKRVNDSTSFVQDGHYLIDRISLKDQLSFLPGESKQIEVSLPVLPVYPNGKYQIQYFVFSSHAFHYGGRAFLEEDYAGVTPLTLEGGADAQVYFDVASVTVNGKAQHIREFTQEFTEPAIKIGLQLVDTRATKSDVPVRVKFYKFEDSNEDFIVQEETKVIPAGQKDITTEFTYPEPGAYVAVFETNTVVRSLLKYRFARAGDRASELRMNDLGITQFPPTQSDRAYVCFHAPSYGRSPLTSVNLEILDSEKKVIEKKTVNGEFSGEISAISVPLSKLQSAKDFWVKASFIQNGRVQKNRDIEIHYSCEAFSDSLSTIDVSYMLDDPGYLRLSPKSICGTQIKNSYLDFIHISRGDTKVQEDSYMSSVPEKYKLATVDPGTYLADIKSGTFRKHYEFRLEGTNAPKSKSRNWLPAGAIGMLLVLGAGVYYIYRKRTSAG